MFVPEISWAMVGRKMLVLRLGCGMSFVSFACGMSSEMLRRISARGHPLMGDFRFTLCWSHRWLVRAPGQ